MPITIHSRFTPLTYDEITKPLLEQTKAQEDLENMYMEASDKANQTLMLANQQTDPVSHRKLKAYSEDLQNQANALLRNGLSAGSRQSLMNLRRRYNQEVVPIQAAATRKEAMMKEQRDAMAKDQTLRFDNDFSTMSLDQLVNNPSMTYQSLSGAQISKMTSDIVSSYAKSIMSDPQLSKVMGNQYWQVRQQMGYTPEQIVAEAANDPTAPAELRAVRESIHNQLSSNKAYSKDWVDSYINAGMSSAVGQTHISYDRNLAQLTAAEMAANERAKERYSFKESKPENWVDIDGTPGYVWDPKTQSIRNKETGAIVLNPETCSKTNPWKDGSSTTDKAALSAAMPIYIKGDAGRKATADSFNVGDAAEYDIQNLTPNQRSAINRELALLGLTLKDVTVYRDRQFGRDVYKVVPKGYTADGTSPLNFEE